MKLSKNHKLLFRLIIIPAILLIVCYLVILVLSFMKNMIQKVEGPAPVTKSFGIVMPKGYSVHGIDVSKHQGIIDWKRVSLMKVNGIQVSFAFIKATEGISRQDNKFEINWKQSAQNGIFHGAYHFYYPSRDASKQAANFIKKVRLTKGDLPPVIDIETSNGKSSAKICEGLKIFAEIIEKQYVVKPIIYTNINFYNEHLKGSFDDNPLWIAGYFDHDRFYSEFSTPWILWQHSEHGKVDGIKGNVDFNVYRGSFEKMKLMLIKK